MLCCSFMISFWPVLQFLREWASDSVILLPSTRISAWPSLSYYYFTYSVYLLLGLSPSLCVIHPRLFFFDFVLTSPWVFAWVGLSLSVIIGLYPNLLVTQPPFTLSLASTRVSVSPSLPYYYYYYFTYSVYLLLGFSSSLRVVEPQLFLLSPLLLLLIFLLPLKKRDGCSYCTDTKYNWDKFSSYVLLILEGIKWNS